MFDDRRPTARAVIRPGEPVEYSIIPAKNPMNDAMPVNISPTRTRVTIEPGKPPKYADLTGLPE